MNKYYLRPLPECTKEYIWKTVDCCSEQASWDAYKAIIAEPHVYFTLADERIKTLDITSKVLDGGFFGAATDGDAGGSEGIYVYLKQRPNAVMFAEDHMAMHNAGIQTKVQRNIESENVADRLLVQLTAGPYPKNIYDITNEIECVGWFLGILCACKLAPRSKEVVHCTYADVLAHNPVFEGLVILGFDAEGYIFLMKKACFEDIYGERECFGHGLDWEGRVFD